MITRISQKKFIAPIALLFFLLSPFSQLEAAIPKLITYQGILKDSAGSYLTGTYSMVFKIYDAATAGNNLWTETQPAVSVSSGRFSVQLGSVTALTLAFSSDYWLSVKVGTDAEMSPRVRLTSAGYAYMAEQVVNQFTQAGHDALTHKNIEGVKDNTVNIAKTNFKLDAYSAATANSMGELVIDTFNDATGIDAALSSTYAWRASPNSDVVVGGGQIDSYTTLMWHMNGNAGDTTITDSSASGHGSYLISSGALDNLQKKFGATSAWFNGSSSFGDAYGTTSDWDFGSGNFTIDFWVRFNTTAANAGLITWEVGVDDYTSLWWNQSALVFEDETVGTVKHNMSWSWSPAVGTWYHVAWVKDGTNFTVFINGTSLGTISDADAMINQNTNIRVGRARNVSGGNLVYLNGWIDEFRVSKGIARWTANFTPPASEYTTSTSGTVISKAWAESVAPTEAMVIADETLGTGSITYSVSRDNGTTWTATPKETVVNISGQPSGTQLRWKAVINGNAELNSMAVAV